jgi:hypothetical protein
MQSITTPRSRSLRTRTSHCCCHGLLRNRRRRVKRGHKRTHKRKARRKRKARKKRKRWKRRKKKKGLKAKKLDLKALLADRACRIVAAELEELKGATMQAQVEDLLHQTAKRNLRV